MTARRVRRAAGVAIAGAIFAAGLAPGARAAPEDAGTVRFVKPAESSFDRYTRSPSRAQQRFMRRQYWRMRAYSPYFDSRLSWFPDAWAYQDLYAIYPRSTVARRHPEWILRDARGRKLYIPFACRGTRCSQYAADVGDKRFRRWWIRTAARKLRNGRYRGLFIDDVNMVRKVSDGAGTPVVPRDDRTRGPMSERRWRAYVAKFAADIRRAFRRREIVHNALWFAPRDRFVHRQTRSADYVEYERGFNDGGLQRGNAPFGIDRFMRQIDWVHGRGRGVVLDGRARDNGAREYGLAGLMLIATPRDALGNDPGSTPDDWWRGYDVTLGAPSSPRYRWHGLLRRDFTRGFVLLNEPGAPVRTVTLPEALRRAAGQRVSSVRLPAASAAVLRYPDPASPPPPPPPPAEEPQPAPPPPLLCGLLPCPP